MHKLLVFDLDGTLAQLGMGMSSIDVEKLRALEEEGYGIAICSGKSTFYLCGFARQLGLKAPVLVGENGAAFQFGIDLPPKRHEIYPYSERAKDQLEMVKNFIEKECKGQIWYQPNEVALTPFPKDEKTFEVIQDFVDERKALLDELIVYRHIDCFDLVPKNINKHNGLKYLTEMMALDSKDVITVGDGVNDIPMFEFADIAIGICSENQSKELYDKMVASTDYRFKTIGEVLDFIKEKKL